MKALLVGTGSIAQRHYRNLRHLGINEVILLRSGKGPASSPALFADCPVFYDLEAALNQQPDVVIIANPAPFHLPIAEACARAGIPMFIEKPLSHNTAGVAALLELVQASDLVVQVGYVLRFHPALIAAKAALEAQKIGKLLALRAEVGQYLPDWRPQADYRQGVSAQAALGGGALLELSHELDYLQWFAGPIHQLSAMVAQVSDLSLDVEDLALLHLHFSTGVLGSLHLDFLQRVPCRQCRLIGTEGSLLLDIIQRKLWLYTPQQPQGELLYNEVHYDPNDMYVAELRHFLQCLQQPQAPVVSLQEAFSTMQVIEAARSAAQQQKVIIL